jgi:hypothetical protein
MKGKNKRFCVDLPRNIHNKIWRMSGSFKINMVAQCLLVEYMTDPDLQDRVKDRLQNRSRKAP